MSLPKTVCRVKVVKRSVLYRNYFFMFAMLIFLTALFSVQTASASGFKFKNPSAQQVGNAYMQQQLNFSQAQTAFENQNFAYSARILKPLALEGHSQAQYLLATQYDLGLGVKRSVKHSFYWYKKAASAGINIAQHNLAVAYAQGNGIEADLIKAVNWWERAANAGNTRETVLKQILLRRLTGGNARQMRVTLIRNIISVLSTRLDVNQSSRI